MSDKKNLKHIIRDAKATLHLASQKNLGKKIEKNQHLEQKIHRVAGNIRSIKVEIKRMKA